MITSKSSDVEHDGKAVPRPLIDKVVAIPFPVFPRRVRYGPIAKVFDFSAWKDCHHSAANDSTSDALEQIMKLSLAEQKLWVIRRVLEIYDFGDRESFYNLYEILCDNSPDSA
jgi:hypothetical protein